MGPDEMFSVWVFELNEKTGMLGYQRKKFNMETKKLKCLQEKGTKFIVDFTTLQIRVKRVNKPVPPEDHSDMPVTSEAPDDTNQELKDVIAILPKVITALKEIDREKDFICILNNIANGQITGHIALHLLLDVGQFLRQQTVHSMRYSDISKNFWTLVQKICKGKGLRFFSGLKGTGLG